MFYSQHVCFRLMQQTGRINKKKKNRYLWALLQHDVGGKLQKENNRQLARIWKKMISVINWWCSRPSKKKLWATRRNEIYSRIEMEKKNGLCDDVMIRGRGNDSRSIGRQEEIRRKKNTDSYNDTLADENKTVLYSADRVISKLFISWWRDSSIDWLCWYCSGRM